MLGSFGEYTLLEKLGEGDMGTTYRAQHPNQPEPLALKILDKVDTSNPMQRGAGVEIVEFAATLQHPKMYPIQAVLDSPEGDGRVGIVMPLAPLGSLGSQMAKGQTPPPKAGLKLIGQVATGLQYLHSQEVAHGSVKPNNLLMDAEGNVSLTDLSMAHVRELGFVPAKPTRQHIFFMQPEREYHAAPEIEGDVFSLAVLSYLLLAGRLPFDEAEPEARGVVPGGNLPPAFAAVLRRALNPQPRMRYKTLGEFMGAIKDATQGKVDRDTEQVFGVKQPPPPPTS